MSDVLEGRLRDWLAAFTRRDLDTYLTYYADDIELYGYAPEVMHRAEVRGWYEAFMGSFEINSQIDETIWDGNRMAFRFTAKARQVETWEGIEPSGKWVAWPGLSFMHWRDGQIVKRYSIQDMEFVKSLLRER